MIDPYHMYLARRPSARAAEAKAKQAQAQAQADTSSASKSSSLDSKSQQSSYIGGDGLSPTSTVSTDHATKSSLAGSSSSSNHLAGLPHTLPDLEYFRQSSPLMPEFNPRTSEFFSHGRRRSSTTLGPETVRSAATGAAPTVGDALPTQRTTPTKKPDKFNLPLTFEESESLAGEQLPVRLGLAPPSHSHGLPASAITYKARVGHGYYFYTPPPTEHPSSSSKASLPALNRRRDTNNSETSAPLQVKVPLPSPSNYSASPPSMSPVAAPTSARGRATSFTSSLLGSTLVGHSDNPKQVSVSTRPRLPPPSSDCWHPEAYFNRTRARVKGKMREYVHHSFPASVVPYWHGYNIETIEAEMTTHLNVNAALHGNTLRDFPEGSRPCRILDLGCGRGMWCLDMAREWKTSEFVGLDIVPIQPPMEQLADPDLERRVSWVVANFLELLPFPDASFDYVHVRFIAQGVPEDKWVDLFSEARRILAPGGVLEVVEGNYSFFGHASLVDAQELKDLETGRTAAKKGSGVKLPRRLKVLNESSDSADIDAIEVILERMMHRRFINPTPLSVVPSALLLPGFANVANGNPRHIPVYAESSAQRARARAAAEGGASSANATSSEDEERRQGKFTSRGQIGKPLNSQFAITDPDLFSALVILQQLDHFSSSRELIWAEAEEEKRSLQGQPQPQLARLDSSRRFGQGHPAALRPFAHPWNSKDQFFRAMDAWVDATRASADTEHMLHKYLGWEQAHEDLTVEGRKCAERRRKMSTSSVAVPSLGLDQLVLEHPVHPVSVATQEQERQDALAAMNEMDQALDMADGGGAFAVATTHAHEAPARLQTTQSSAPNALDTKASHVDTNETDAAKTSGKRVKKSKRPSSSGGVSTSTASTLSAGSSRNRTFGRGGAGGNMPRPEPPFMTGYAFGSPATETQSMFRAPATKASIIASSRSARKGSSSRSFSDKSSTSGMTDKEKEKEDIRTAPVPHSAGGVTKISPTNTPATAHGVTSAEAYAAIHTQRVSHGLEDEYCREQIEATSSTEATSRPVSPTTGVPAIETRNPGTQLAGRPRLTAHAIGSGADARSVSMPAQVRIAEPLNRPSKDSRSKSKSSAKAVAMIGFYDTTGFLATA